MNLELLQIKGTMTSLEVAEITGKEHKNILSDIRDEIEKLGEERGQLIFQPSYYINSQNKQQPMFMLNIQGILQLGARYNADVRFKLIEKVTKKETIEIKQSDDRELKIKESELYLKYANSFNNEKYRETMLVLGANKLNGSDVLPLPKIERKSYTATEIGEMIGINAKRVGSIAKAKNLKTDEYGYWAFDKSRYSSKQVETFRYYENVINEMKKYV